MAASSFVPTIAKDPVDSATDRTAHHPHVGPVPNITRGFQVRVDLLGAKPPVWRRIVLPGDITLPDLHAVLQLVMGWWDAHLHMFRTGSDRHAHCFRPNWDDESRADRPDEAGIRLDQVVTEVGDRLWYDYDFGDGWEHVLRVEKVLDTPPPEPRCVTGRKACPPEDCGGLPGYEELATWARNDYAPKLLPEVFASVAEAIDWLPEDWHPDDFDVEQVNTALSLHEFSSTA